MASTNTEIINLALAKLGSATISDWSDATKEGRIATAVFTNTREWLQEKFPWNFCLNRVELTSGSNGYSAISDGNKYDEYEYYWTFNSTGNTLSDCLRVYEIVENPLIKWAVEQNKLYSTVTPIVTRYIKKVTDPTKFPPAFTYALSLAIAIEIAPVLTGSRDLRTVLKNEFIGEIQNAYLLNAIEGRSRIGKGSKSLDLSGTTWQEER